MTTSAQICDLANILRRLLEVAQKFHLEPGINPSRGEREHQSGIENPNVKARKKQDYQNELTSEPLVTYHPKELKDLTFERLSKWKEMPSIEKEYTELKMKYEGLFGLQDIYDTDIDHDLISPNRLHPRFSKPVLLVETKLCQEVAEAIDGAEDDVTFKGPIGIGKSHAMLAKVLQLRRQGHIVLYINYPQEWIRDESLYLINELIYACIPISNILSLPEYLEAPAGVEVDNLLIWFCALKYCVDLGKDSLSAALDIFKSKFRNKTKTRKTYAFLDQENAFVPSNINKNPVGEKFPWRLRSYFCEKTVISYSANNTLTAPQKEQTSLDCFMQMTLEQIGKIARRLEPQQRTFSESDIKALFKACNGNPLEATIFLKNWRGENQNVVFQNWIQDYFKTRVLDIFQKHKTEFMMNRSKEFGKDFDKIVVYVDANTKLDTYNPLFPQIYDLINQQYIYIEEKTKLLKTLVPAAAIAFQSMKSLSEIDGALRVILFETAEITADTIGRLLEFYLLKQLKDKGNQSFSLKYNTTTVKDQIFLFYYSEVMMISRFDNFPDRVPTHSALFIPENPNYPHVDLIYYDKPAKIIYPIQVTVNLEAHKASHTQFEQKELEAWKKFLGVTDLQMQFIWIGGGWNPQKLKLQNSSDLSKTPGSWYISYKQFPTTSFSLFSELHQRNFFVDTAIKIDKIPLNGLTSKWSDATLQKSCIKWLSSLIQSQRKTIKVYFYYDSNSGDASGQTRGAFLEFRDLQDAEEFKSKFKSTTSDLDCEEIQMMSNYEEQGWRVITVPPGMEME